MQEAGSRPEMSRTWPGSVSDAPSRKRTPSASASSPKSIWWLTKMDVIGFRVVCPVEEQVNLKGLKSKVTKKSE